MRKESRYEIHVETNVIATTEDGSILETKSQTINNSIKIGVKFDSANINPDTVKFIQFITRQSPCIYTWDQEKRAEWISDRGFTSNMNLPAWKIDTIHADEWNPPKSPSPFYDDGGFCKLEHDGKFMYDQPELTNLYERVVATTFIILDSKVIGEVRWSRQNEISLGQEMQTTYCVQILETVNQLPDWALYVLEDEYRNNAFYKLVYEIPKYLQHEKKQSPMEAQLTSSQSFVTPPKNWVLSNKFINEEFAMLLPHVISYQNAFCFFCAVKENYPENYKPLYELTLLDNRVFVEKSKQSQGKMIGSEENDTSSIEFK